jgi:hypothetical protein
MKKTIFILLTLLIASTLRPQPVSAASQNLIRVSPVILPIELSPGKISTYEITVENLTSNPLPLKATIEGFDSQDEDGGYVFTADNATPPLVNWTTVDQPDLILESNKPKKLTITVKVPSTVSFGAYYAVIFLTPFSNQITNQPTIIPKIGVLLLANLGITTGNETPESQISILTNQFNHYFTDKFPLDLTLRVKNIALHYLTVKPIVKINNLITGNSETQELSEKIILPGKVRRWQDQIIPKYLKYGVYQIKINVSIGAGIQLSQYQYLVVVPYKETLIITISLLIIYVLFTKRRNILKAMKALIKG